MKEKIWLFTNMMTGIVLLVFTVFILFSLIEGATDEDYRFAVIGAIGSIIGGSLTLVGVQMTLNKQKNENYISDFPKKITHLDLVKNEINRINNENHSLLDLTNNMKNYERKEYFNQLKVMSINIDGIVYFIIKNLEKEFENHKIKADSLIEYEKHRDNIITRALSIESSRNINNVKEELLEIISDTIRKIEEHEEVLTRKFFEIMK